MFIYKFIKELYKMTSTKETIEDIFIIFESLNNDSMYDFNIIDGLLNKLKYIFIFSIENNNKIYELNRWKNIFHSLGYNEESYIFQWINELYNEFIVGFIRR